MKGTLLYIFCMIRIQPYSVFCTERNCIFLSTSRCHGIFSLQNRRISGTPSHFALCPAHPLVLQALVY